MRENNTTVVIPIHTRPVTSIVKMGDMDITKNTPVEVEVESNIAAIDKNTFVADTVVVCENKKVGFCIMIQLETLLLGCGTIDQISKIVRKQLRNEIFSCAEIMVWKLSQLHGCPLKIDLIKNIENSEKNGEEFI
jgi:hypothetical protein